MSNELLAFLRTQAFELLSEARDELLCNPAFGAARTEWDRTPLEQKLFPIEIDPGRLGPAETVIRALSSLSSEQPGRKAELFGYDPDGAGRGEAAGIAWAVRIGADGSGFAGRRMPLNPLENSYDCLPTLGLS